MRTLPAGERSLLVDLAGTDEVHDVWSALRADPPPGAEDIVAGATTVLVVFATPARRRAGEAAIGRLARRPGTGRRDRPEVTIRVAYDGPDLPGLAELTGLPPQDIARLHCEAVYTVAFLGFSPGFAYLTGAHPALDVPRLSRPRTSVPAGSVAVAAGLTAVYPQPTPGGWHLIGRTDAVLFDAGPGDPVPDVPGRAGPALLQPGDRVRFQPVERVGPPPAVARADEEPAGLPGRSYLHVLESGALTTVQDRGRPGWAHLGVPVAGAADRAAAAAANRLVGNPPDAAVLEATLAGPRLRAGSSAVVAVTGARADITVDGLPARQDTPLHLGPGAELAVGAFRTGVRAYIAVRGGIAVRPVLGSRSSDTLSGLGPAPLRPGRRLPVGPVPPGPVGSAASGPAADSGPAAALEVRAFLGPRHDWLTPGGLETLGTVEFRVQAASDRTGLRLAGPPVEARRAQLPSEGMATGSVQIPPDGQPIVLLRNHPTTGGYPVAAVVAEADVDRLAQARPGTAVRFRLEPVPR